MILHLISVNFLHGLCSLNPHVAYDEKPIVKIVSLRKVHFFIRQRVKALKQFNFKNIDFDFKVD